MQRFRSASCRAVSACWRAAAASASSARTGAPTVSRANKLAPQDRGHRGETRGAHPIGSVLVFLHLLEGEIERIAKRLLVHAQEQATRSDSAADLDINWVWHTGAAAVFRSRRGLFGTLPRLL